jgi:hypothetical protein
MVYIHNEAYSELSEQLWLAENFMFLHQLFPVNGCSVIGA